MGSGVVHKSSQLKASTHLVPTNYISLPQVPPSSNPFADFDIVHSNTTASAPRVNKRPSGKPRPVRLSRDQQAKAAHKLAMSKVQLSNVKLVKFLEGRKVNSCRVVYENKSTNKSESKVGTLREAWDICKSLGLDFTLITPEGNVRAGKEVIVKCVDLEEIEKEKRRKEREARDAPKNKQKSVKEFKFGGGIGTHDRDRLITRAIQSLSKGHQVKITLQAKRRELNINPLCMFDLDEYIGRALEGYGMVNEGRRLVKEGMGRHNCVWTPRQNAGKVMETRLEDVGTLWDEEEL
ncbi:hypothetical protein TrCOL_g13202 [Triparma columacea]|uniref:Uncharacterized protein n=1 Tax=Triparma columacea TaxID=722753 RepID=A0A9W7FYV4_9STRA|nr:hypothetical protein TrCOL_g13202 [Triparma columacea]